MQIKSWHLAFVASLLYLFPMFYVMGENFSACKGVCVYDYAINYLLMLAVLLILVSLWRWPGTRKAVTALSIPLSLLIAAAVLSTFQAHMALRYFTFSFASRWWSGNMLFYVDLTMRSLSSILFFLSGLIFLLREGGAAGLMGSFTESKAWKSAWWGAVAYCVLIAIKVAAYFGASQAFIAENPNLFLLTLLPYVLQVLLLAVIVASLRSGRAVKIGAVMSILAGYRIALFAFGSLYRSMQVLSVGGGYSSVAEYARYSLLTTAVLLISSALLFLAGFFFYLRGKGSLLAAATQK